MQVGRGFSGSIWSKAASFLSWLSVHLGNRFRISSGRFSAYQTERFDRVLGQTLGTGGWEGRKVTGVLIRIMLANHLFYENAPAEFYLYG